MDLYKRCIMILADGSRPDVMESLIHEGRLPSIGEHLVREGSLRHAVSVFPSTTGPAYLPYLTGCYPGTCNVPGIRWFDKEAYASRSFSLNRFRSYVGIESYLMNYDLAPERKTLFEIIPKSINVFSPISRGVSLRGNKTLFSRFWYWYYAHLTDRWGFVDQAADRLIEKSLREDPEFLFAVFPGIDEYSHLSSPFHQRTLEAYEDLDRAVGRMVSRLKREGKWEETLVLIVSDHGLSETQRHFTLNQFLEKAGIRTFYYPKIVFKSGFEAASMVSGNAMSNVYFKNGEGWNQKTTWEVISDRKDKIISRLLDQPEVDMMASLSEDGSLVVKSRRGEARLSRRSSNSSTIVYRVVGADPFGYGTMPSILTDREVLGLTAASDYPDAPVQLLQIFRSKRAGDMVLSAAKGSDLRLRYEIHEHKSSHGSLSREHMMVPLVTNAKLPSGLLRSVDVFPTILELLGRPVPEGIDGVSLFPS